MDLIFTKQADRWVAEFIATDDFNLHIEGVVEGNVSVFQRGSESGNYAFVKEGTPYPSTYANVYDYDFAALIYPKFIKVSCATEPTSGIVTSDGEITEIKAQTKEIEVTSNGTTTVTPDEGFAYLNSVKVTTNVPTSGEGGGSASSVEYLDVRNIDEDLKWSLINSSYLVKIPKEYVLIYPTLFAKNDYDDELYVDTVAIAIDFSASVLNRSMGVMTIKEMISNDNGYPLEVFDSIPRLTEEEFYNIA